MLITRISINRPIATLMVSLALIFLGVVSWNELPVQRLPDVTFPSMYYGAWVQGEDLSSEQTNELLTRPFEKMVASLPGLKGGSITVMGNTIPAMRSRTYSNHFWGYACFEQGTDMRFRVIELQDRVNKWLAGRPEKIEVRIVPQSTDELAGHLMDLILSVPVAQEFRVAVVSDLIRRKIRSIDGISQVEIAGEMFPNIKLETQRDELVAQGLSVSRLMETVNANAEQRSWLGMIREGPKSHAVHFDSAVKTLDELLGLGLDPQGVVRLGDVVRPRHEVRETESVFRFNGKKSVRITVNMEQDRNTIQMARKVREQIAEIKKDLPRGFDLSVASDEAADLEKLIHKLAKLVSMGALLAMLVLLVFTWSWRVSLVIMVAIPVSLTVTFNAMYAAGLSVNLLSLLGLGVGVGMLVDNSIVVVENIFRHFQRVREPRVAAWGGAQEVGRAILISTATNLAVFIPLVFLDEITAMIVKEMALALVFAMTVSLVVAVTLIPMLTSKIVGEKRRSQESGVRSQETEDRRQETEDRRQESGDRRQESGDRSQESEVRSQKKEVSSHKSEEGILKKEDENLQTLNGEQQTVNCKLQTVNCKLRTAIRNPWSRPPGRRPRNLLREFVLFCAKASIRHPVRLVFSILGLFLVTLFISGLKVAFQKYGGDQKTETIALYGKPPVGSTLEEADAFFLEKEKLVAEEIAKSDAFESFSSRFTKTGGEIELRVAEKYRRLSEGEFRSAFRRLSSGDRNSGFRFTPFPEASTEIAEFSRRRRGGSGSNETVLVTGENTEAMLSAARLVEEFLKSQPDVGEVRMEVGVGDPEVHFLPDIERFLVMQADTRGLQSFFRARDDRGMETSLKLEEAGVERLVTLRVITEEEKREEGARQTLSELKRVMVPLAGGGMVPLEQLGTFLVTHGSPPISKENRQRNLRVGFDFKPQFYRPGMEKKKQESLMAAQKKLNALRLPMGISASLKGTLEEAKQSRLTLRKMLGLAALAVYLVMAFFFESVGAPLVILITLPLALIGGLWGLILLNANLDEIAMVGMVLLAGLVVNNGILLIEYARQMERRGFRRQRAMLAAVSYRLRPILMTSLTTILGLLPILLSKTAEKEARSLVSVLIGGMVVSSLLSLVVVPTLYNVFCLGTERLPTLKRFLPRRLRAAFPLIPAPAYALTGPSAQWTAPGTPGGLFAAPLFRSSIPRPASPLVPGQKTSVRRPASAETLRLSVRNVSKIYPAFRMRKLLNAVPSRRYPYGHRPLDGTAALRRISLEVGPGMFGLLGPNGAGKTTLMKILTGIIEPTYGAVEVGGYDLRRFRHEIRRLISYLPQDFGVYESLTLEQYLNFLAPLCGLDDLAARRAKVAEVIEFVGLEAVRSKRMKQYSGGMRQRAGIAQLLLDPRPILVVDEPTAGLDPAERVRFRLLLSELARTRVVLLSTHIVEDITSSCNRVAVLHRGSVVYEGGLDGVLDRGRGLIWNVTLPSENVPPIPRRCILFRKYVHDRIFYHYVAENPLPGSEPVSPSFEDAYVALLLQHDAAFSPEPPAE